MFRMMTTAIALSMLLVAGVATAADSPQFRGPNRDGKFAETGLMKAWPEGGPALIWKAEGIGFGYASVSVVGDTIYVPGMMDDNQGYLTALDLAGQPKWKVAYGEETQNKQGPGSRSTPTIDGDRVYLLSGPGVLSCLSAKDGAPVWQVNIMERFGGKVVDWVQAESLLVDGDRVYCTPGGPDASVVALNKMTGETIWTSKGLSDASAYCSPNIIDHNGRRILVTMTAKLVVGIDPASGAVLWTHEHETDYDIHAVTPVYEKGMLYYTAGYKSGGGMLELAADGASITPKWRDENLDCQHHGVVLQDGYIYGTAHQSGREMLCLELATRKVVWRTGDIRQGAVVYADGMLYVYEGPSAGVVSLVKATPEKFERTGSFTIEEGEGNHWAHPVVAGKRLYIRHGELLFAYDIAAK